MLSLLAAAAATVITPGQPITLSEIDTAIRQFNDYKPRDTFDAAPVPDFDGRQLDLVIPFTKEMSATTASWGYDAQAQELRLYVPVSDFSPMIGSAFWGAKLPPSTFIDWTLQYDGDGGGSSYHAQNGFGAEVEVTRYSSSSYRLFLAKGEYQPRTYTFKMAPDEARALVPHLRAHITATLSHWSSPGSVGCMLFSSPATFSSPRAIQTRDCAIAAQDVVAIVEDDRQPGEPVAIIAAPKGRFKPRH